MAVGENIVAPERSDSITQALWSEVTCHGDQGFTKPFRGGEEGIEPEVGNNDVVGGLTRGLDKVSVIEKVYPNQGIWLSLRNLILIWLVVGFGVSLLIWPYATVTMGPDPGVTWNDAAAALPDSLFLGSVTGMLVGFGYAGLDVVYHVALRTILWLKRIAPLVSYATFLNNAAYLGFLRKVGGGYMFLHGSLRKQFEEPE